MDAEVHRIHKYIRTYIHVQNYVRLQICIFTWNIASHQIKIIFLAIYPSYILRNGSKGSNIQKFEESSPENPQYQVLR